MKTEGQREQREEGESGVAVAGENGKREKEMVIGFHRRTDKVTVTTLYSSPKLCRIDDST